MNMYLVLILVLVDIMNGLFLKSQCPSHYLNPIFVLKDRDEFYITVNVQWSA